MTGMDLKKLITEKRLMVDGGMGTLLQSMGLAGGQRPETWNMTYSDRVLSVHQQYLEAGCDVITANTFGANALHFGKDTELIIKSGVKLCRRAVEKHGHGYVAMDIGPTGRLLQPYGDLPCEEAVSLCNQAAQAGAQAGADLILIETMSDSYELKAAVLGAKEGCSLPIVATLMMNENGKMLTGGDLAGMAAMLEGLGVTALGFNCGLGPKQMKPLVEALRRHTSLPIWCSPNAGLPQVANGATVFTLEPEEFGREAAELCRLGVSVIGGCCGTTPAHLKAAVQACRHIPLPELMEKDDCVICSHGCTVALGNSPRIIGERINPTGKKAFKAALKADDLDYVLREAVSQAQAGAHILDVNVGLPEIDEVRWMQRAVTGIQSVCALPLQLDTANPVALEAALRLYNGKALINSVSAKQQSMDDVFPLVKKYGGAVVCLLLDEEGIPETVEGRLMCARKIVSEAAKYGIPKHDLVMDALVMTVSTGSHNARLTLETVRRLKNELGLRTVLGVSNVSFGLPQREKLNAAFLTMALEAGLDAAIMNPLSPGMMNAFFASQALLGRDDRFEDYLSRYASAVAAPAAPQGEMTVEAAIAQGLKNAAAQATQALLAAGAEPLAIVSEHLVPALDQVGQGFEKGTVFLPQLLMSAEAAKAAFQQVKTALSQKNQTIEKKGKVLLATVQGDVHDIGKNIVKVLLENYHFDVIDLGKDVPPQKVLDEAIRHGVQLVGLSALMTTTVPSMEATISLIRQQQPHIRVMVGGAVLTQSFADLLGADFYARDAMASVGYALKVYGS